MVTESSGRKDPRDRCDGDGRAADQVQVSVDTAVVALDRSRWDILVAEERPREAAGTGVDAVIGATARVT